MRGKKFAALFAVALAAALSNTAQAAALASDVASDIAYDDGWATGDNGGTGFGPWTLNTFGSGGVAGHFIGNSSNNAGGSSGNINTAGESFGLFAEPGMVSEAIRPFTGALTVGQIFLIDFDNGWIQDGGTVGLGLQNNASQNRIEFFFIGGQTTYKIQTGATQTDSGVGFTGDGLRLEFTLTGADTMKLVIKNTGGSTLATFSNLALGGNAGSGIDRVRLFNASAGPGSNHDAFYNSLRIIPEPTTALLVGLGVMGAMLLRRRSS
ncbi:MAG: PEP-CTERM sorting domain-containing protein [Verrucomicrobiae bacterium]|nr:PEP-CTERM sorting domain-containing protein [Verrucomicrobiae bacterium]MDW8342879.1 PEP-CTERM sorting domain-containing protein [Verrucomicrobiae bacterium]